MGDTAELHGAFREVVDVLLDLLNDLIEELMQRDKGRPLHVPVSLLGLVREVYRVSQLLVQEHDHLRAHFLGQVVAGLPKSRVHIVSFRWLDGTLHARARRSLSRQAAWASG